MARWKPPRKADDLPEEAFNPDDPDGWLPDDADDLLVNGAQDWKNLQSYPELSRAEMWRIDSGSLYDYTLVGGTEQLSYRLDDMLSADETPVKVITNYGQLRDHINRVFHDQGPVKFCRMMQTWLTSKSLKDAIFLLMEPPGYLTSDAVCEIDDAWGSEQQEDDIPMTRWKPKKKVPDEQHIFYESVDENGAKISTVDMRREPGTDLYERTLGMRIRLELPRGYQTTDGLPMRKIVAASYGTMIGWIEELYVRVSYTVFIKVLASLLQSQEVRMRVRTIAVNDWWGLEYDRVSELGYNSTGQYTAFSIGEVVTDILSGVQRG